MIITVDGVDGVGKTTICNVLKIRLSATVVHGVSRRPEDEMGNYDIEARYLSRLAEYLKRDRAVPKTDATTFVIDRSLYSVVAQFTALGVQLIVDGLFALVPTPDVSVYLTCPKDRWRKALLSKGTPDWFERHLLEIPGLDVRVEEEYDKLGLRRISNENEAIAVATILALINEARPRPTHNAG